MLRSWLIPLGVVCALALLPATADAKICGRVLVAPGHRAKVHVVRGPLSCSDAHREIALAFQAEATRHWDGTGTTGVFWRVNGWRCSIGLGGSETFCHRGTKQVDGSFRTDDGWYF